MRLICKTCNREIETNLTKKNLKCKVCKELLVKQEEISCGFITSGNPEEVIAIGDLGGVAVKRDGRLWLKVND
ncbi:MAG: hypothetical protein WC796_01935 [Candidatus Pacearchaeota archaeon]|jgi:hypothetical protein